MNQPTCNEKPEVVVGGVQYPVVWEVRNMKRNQITRLSACVLLVAVIAMFAVAPAQAVTYYQQPFYKYNSVAIATVWFDGRIYYYSQLNPVGYTEFVVYRIQFSNIHGDSLSSNFFSQKLMPF